MDWHEAVAQVAHLYSPGAYALTLLAGALALAVEWPAYARRGRRREAALARALGWAYVAGGTALFLVVQGLRLALDLEP